MTEMTATEIAYKRAEEEAALASESEESTPSLYLDWTATAIYGSVYDQVSDFWTHFQIPRPKQMVAFPSEVGDRVITQMRLIEEEFRELQKGVDENDLVQTADAICDLIFVLYGLAIDLGLPIRILQNEVFFSNMSKTNLDGSIVKREDGKILKGTGYVPANIHLILRRFLEAQQA